MRCLIVGLVVAACGGSETEIDKICAADAEDHCTKLQMCSPAALGRRWADFATCTDREKLGCVESLSAPETAETAASQDACAQAASALSCPDWFQIEPPDACLPPPGPYPVGQACGFPSQCSTAFCAVAPSAVCGTCQPPPAAGASCVDTGCAPNMTCVQATMQCQIPVAEHGACDRTLPCNPGLTCVGASTTPPITMGTCMMSVELEGGTCDPSHTFGADCDPLAGLSCDLGTHLCVPEPLANPGEACGAVGSALTRCASGATCYPIGRMTGSCFAPAADGAACDTAAGPGCLFPARCVTASSTATTGTCQLPGKSC